MKYYLYPPFFVIEPQISFSDAWETFCCQLLNLANKTHTITRIIPPDDGVDLLWDAEKIAYQCKSVKLGSKLDLVKVKGSIDKALKKQANFGWQRYVLCTNIDLTGQERAKIKKMLQNIEFITGTQWIGICEQFPNEVGSRFNQLITIPKNKIIRLLESDMLEKYKRTLESKKTEIIKLIIYSKQSEKLFELPISIECTIKDLLAILIDIFKLPEVKNFHQLDISFDLEHAILINNDEVPLTKKISELELENIPIVTFFSKFKLNDTKGQLEGNVFQLITPESLTYSLLSKEERIQMAVDRYKEEMNQLFENATIRFRKRLNQARF